jgi:hypothetical protein
MKYFALLILFVSSLSQASQAEITNESDLSPLALVQTLAHDTYYSFNFGHVRVGVNAYAQWNIRAKTAINFKGVYWQGDDYETWTTCPKVLPPGQSCTVGVTFRPIFQGQRLGRIYVDMYTERFIIDLIGWGTR